MNQKIRNFIHQPLVHFLLIGVLLFFVYYQVNPDALIKDSIVINDDQVERMVLVFQKEWNRSPTEEEMKGLLNRYLQQEVYYRKALHMNLDQNDEIIRRRLEQKLRFVTSDLANLTQPTNEELRKFYITNKQKYLNPKKITFSHIYFNTDKRKDAEKDAKAVLNNLKTKDTNILSITQKGDPFPFASQIDSLSATDIDKSMGDGFSVSLEKMPLGKWSGPILSGYGYHLVFVQCIKSNSEKDFGSIKEELMRDYHYMLQNDYNNKLFDAYKKDFSIVLDIKNPKNNKPLLSKLIGADGKN